MCGNSTRQINQAVNNLFKGYIVVVKDHYMAGTYRLANRLLFSRILDRVSKENNLDGLIADKLIRIDKEILEIELL